MTLSPCGSCGAPHRLGTACPSCGERTSATTRSTAQRVLGLVLGAGLLTGCPAPQPPYGAPSTDKTDTAAETGDTGAGATTTE